MNHDGMDAASLLKHDIACAKSIGFSALSQSWQVQYTPDDKFRKIQIAFIGEFNHGKSSLINAIAGIRVLPVGIVPTTKINTSVEFHAQENAVSAWLGTNRVKTWPWNDWQKNALRLTTQCLEQCAIDRIEITLTPAGNFQDCILMDTPGLNEASLKHENALRTLISRSDIAVFVLDAGQTITQTEIDIFQRFLSALPPERRLIAVNKCDMLDDGGVLEVCAYIETMLAPSIHFGERLFMLSSKSVNSKEFLDFSQSLQHACDQCKKTGKAAATARALKNTAACLHFLTPLCRAVFDMPIEELRRLHGIFLKQKRLNKSEIFTLNETITNNLQQLRALLLHEIELFETDFLRAMPRELEKALLNDIENYFEGFIDSEFMQFTQQLQKQFCDGLYTPYAMIWKTFAAQSPMPVVNVQNIPMKHMRALTENFTPTGAFETASPSIARTLLQHIPISKLEHSRRMEWRKMGTMAIQRRSREILDACIQDFQAITDGFCALLDEMGQDFGYHMAQALEHWLHKETQGRNAVLQALNDIDDEYHDMS